MKTLFTSVEHNKILFEIEYTYIPAQPGKYLGRPEDCYPDEPAEIELISVALPTSSINLVDILNEECYVGIEEIILARHELGELE